jgi:putative sterol carrier protein
MALTELQAHLLHNFHPPASQGMDATFRLVIEKESLTFRVDHGSCEFLVDPEPTPDVTFYFQDVDTAWALLSGRGNAIEAFMQGRFRADGYLMWAFALMAMFQSPSLPSAPTE